MAPYTLQASRPRHWSHRVAPLKAPQLVLFGVAPTLLRHLILVTGRPGWRPERRRSEVSDAWSLGLHPPRHLLCHWPLRMAPLEAPQRGVLAVAPTPSRLLIPGTGHSGWPPQRHCGEVSDARPHTSSGSLTPATGHSGWRPQKRRSGSITRCPVHTPGLSSSALAAQDGAL